VRAELIARARRDGLAALHAELAAVDAEAAGRIHPNDQKRIVRAVQSRWFALIDRNEIYERSGTVIAVAITSQAQAAGFPLTMELAPKQLPKRSWVKISQIRTLAVEVGPLYELMKAEVLSSHKIHTDDTPVRLRDARKHQKCESRIWTYVGDRAHPYTVFDYTANRRRDGPVAFLGSWKGYLQADAFAGYDCIFASKDVIEVACMAHARRKFEDALATDQDVANEALALIGKLYTLERGWKELTDDERKAQRQEHARPLLDEFERWLKAARGRVLPKSPAGKAVRYALRNWQALCRYTEHGELDIDNNAAERSLRSVAIGRKNWLFFGSHAGGQAAATFFSLIASAKRHDLDPFEYLRDLFERLPAYPAKDRRDFLPDRWKQLRQQQPAQ
jgi:mRNA-degrading endonuclease toxin of MazEF toxin-antitoxin module